MKNKEKEMMTMPVCEKNWLATAQAYEEDGREKLSYAEQKHGMTAEEFRREVTALLERYPHLRQGFAQGEGLPKAVIATCIKERIPLQVAYAEYTMRQAQEKLEQMRRENEILKQNMTAANKAPVKGTVLGGSTNAKGKDPFLEGLFAED